MPVSFACRGLMPLPVGGAATPIHLTSPNNFQDASWREFGGATVQDHVRLDPLGGNTASFLQNTTTGGFSAWRTTIPTTLTNGVHYSLTGYLAHRTSPDWMQVLVIGSEGGGGTDYVSIYINASTGVSGTSSVGGSGLLDPGTTYLPDANSYFKLVFNFYFPSGLASDAIVDLRPADADGGVPANTQEFDAWGWGA